MTRNAVIRYASRDAEARPMYLVPLPLLMRQQRRPRRNRNPLAVALCFVLAALYAASWLTVGG